MWQFPSLSTSLIHPLSLIYLPPHHPAHRPPPLLVCPCQGLEMHVACWLSVSLVVTVVGWPVHGGSPRDRLRVFTLRRLRLYGPGLVTLGLFSTERGLSFSGLDPCFVSSDTEGPPTQGRVYLGVGALVLSCILLLTTVKRCTLCPWKCLFHWNTRITVRIPGCV